MFILATGAILCAGMSTNNDEDGCKMKKAILATLGLAAICQSPAHAISEKYGQQLEHSGCTQQTELQGCDVHKSKAQNARSGVGRRDDTNGNANAGLSAFAGNYLASHTNGHKMADIHIEQGAVYVNGKEIKDVNHVGDVMTFQQGYVTYTLYANQLAKDGWSDPSSGSSGPIRKE